MSDAPESPIPETNPRTLRRSSHGVIGGVASGLGERFDVDANLFRVGFVVSSILWGLGLALYLTLWAILPRSDAEDALETLPSPSSRRLVVALGAAIVIFGVLVFSLWHPVHRFGTVVALLWLAFLVVLAVIALRTTSRHVRLRRLVAMAFLGALSFMILLIGALMGFLDSTGVPLAGGNGVHSWSPSTLSQVQSSYRTEFGTTTVDLSHVRFPDTGFVVNVSTAIGTAEVIVPPNAVVTLTTRVGIGHVTFPRWNGSRFTPPFSVTPAPPPAAQSRPSRLVLTIQVGIGQVSVERG